ncbi:multicellular organism reproduction [Seminavis robusta]|uniref:Multicellular organism reproduction n=1 Tax=Seminavis robusta TaxID=568900 RepID=A0A9N8HPX9_9STRA|nr:multicellular organism reproduction [Seminavis robusta]|eukprot:Sro938_g222250.1 multicellular organism reproduction (1637) ;mRNA; f:4501-9496
MMNCNNGDRAKIGNGNHNNRKPRKQRMHRIVRSLVILFAFTACVGNYVWLSRQHHHHQSNNNEDVIDIPNHDNNNNNNSNRTIGMKNMGRREKAAKALGIRDHKALLQNRILSQEEKKGQLKSLRQHGPKGHVPKATSSNVGSSLSPQPSKLVSRIQATKEGSVAPKQQEKPNNNQQQQQSLSPAETQHLATTIHQKNQTQPKVVFQGGPVKVPKKKKKRAAPLAQPKVVKDESIKTILKYAPSRIPGYFTNHNDTRILFGHVMREFTRRIMPTRDPYNPTQSGTILVISPDATEVVQMLQSQPQGTSSLSAEQEGELRRQIRHTVGGCTLIHAHKQGHAYHGFNHTTSTARLKDWWQQSNKKNLAGGKHPQPTEALLSSPPHNHHLLLAMIDHGLQTDEILNNQSGTHFLQQSNPRYIVLSIGAYRNGTFYGQQAVQTLLKHHYKVMILSLSHVPFDADRRTLVAPNALLTPQSTPAVFDVLTMGAKMMKKPILGFVFATQGFDMAIPTATLYQPQIGRGSTGVEYAQCPTTGLNLQLYNSRVEQTLTKAKKTKNKGRTPFGLTCQGQKMAAPYYDYTAPRNRDSVENNNATVWFDGEYLSTSEAVCVKAICSGEGDTTSGANVPRTACATRIRVPQSKQKLPSDTVVMDDDMEVESVPRRLMESRPRARPPPQQVKAPDSRAVKQETKPNLLMLMVESISRPRFERSLVKTNKILEKLNFTAFSRYTAISNNSSAANQAALFSGKHHHHSGAKRDWLWETLRARGYATLKAADTCAASSSTSTAADHGAAFREMMCFDFLRPNCLGERSAAQHLIDYGTQFMNVYDDLQQPWAAILQFVDAKEDSQTLEGTLDEPLWKFLFAMHHGRHCGSNTKTPPANAATNNPEPPVPCSVWDNTLIVVLSDQGMDYGTYALSPLGLKERSMPVLAMHLPKKSISRTSTNALEANRQRWTTPMDVYDTILDVLESKEVEEGVAEGSLVRSLSQNRVDCKTTPGVPSYLCNILQHNTTADALIMQAPPSVMSFYADVPRANKDPRPFCDVKQSNDTIFNNESECMCATNNRSWHECTQHPWALVKNGTSGDTFSMVDCGDTGRLFEIHVHRNPEVVERPEVVHAKSSSGPRPNILFVEMDSVSTAYADRHMRRTRELLSTIRMTKNSTVPGGFACGGSEKICAVEFETVSVVGASSIPNQVAVMGGCQVGVGPEVCSSLEADAHNRSICTDPTHQAYGMELVNRLRTSATFCRVDEANRSPWIFDIAKSSGYATLFAEDFCYDGSVYVPQNNVFTLNADILPAKFFCRVSELRAAKIEDGPEMVRPAWQYTYKPSQGNPACVDESGGYESGLIALHHIESMWDTYQDIPKLAYINGIAAHAYREFRTMADDAETYDIMLSSFLRRMMAKKDMSNTIIVVRADHGLQAGPATPDYSIQVEALRPWTEIIVPKTLAGLSLSNLYENRQQLTTGFDLYNTLTTAIVGTEKGLVKEPPSWSHHLWNEVIPDTRTCADAQVKSDYCLYESQRSFSAPNLRSCNMVEDDQRLVCPFFSDEFKEEMSSSVSNFFYSSTIQEKVCPAEAKDATTTTTKSSFVDEWNMIDKRATTKQRRHHWRTKCRFVRRPFSVDWSPNWQVEFTSWKTDL